MNPCRVCDSPLGVHGHHVVPQAKGGREGPVVDLCASCHDLLHRVVSREIAGKSADEFFSHLPYEAQRRLLGLVKIALAAHAAREDKSNPNPLLAVRLESHAYLRALHMMKADRGFTSIDALINDICRTVAKKYGLVS